MLLLKDLLNDVLIALNRHRGCGSTTELKKTNATIVVGNPQQARELQAQGIDAVSLDRLHTILGLKRKPLLFDTDVVEILTRRTLSTLDEIQTSIQK